MKRKKHAQIDTNNEVEHVKQPEWREPFKKGSSTSFPVGIALKVFEEGLMGESRIFGIQRADCKNQSSIDPYEVRVRGDVVVSWRVETIV